MYSKTSRRSATRRPAEELKEDELTLAVSRPSILPFPGKKDPYRFTRHIQQTIQFRNFDRRLGRCMGTDSGLAQTGKDPRFRVRHRVARATFCSSLPSFLPSRRTKVLRLT